MRRSRQLFIALIAGVVAVIGSALPAHAEDGYRFWSYYSWNGQEWTFASTGPTENVPEDGSVEGWRFAVSGNTPRVPRTIGDFDLICDGVPAEADRKRVAVIIDHGTAEDSPEAATLPEPTGTCVVAPVDATGVDLLAKVTDVRIETNMVCGVASHPPTGCGDPVANIDVPTDEEAVELTITNPVGSQQWDPSTAPTEDRSTATPEPQPADSDSDWQTWALGGGMLIVIVGVGFFLTRRRQKS